jgi:hypothetical protein
MATPQNTPTPSEIAADFVSIEKALKAHKKRAMDLVAPADRKALRAQVDAYYTDTLAALGEIRAMVAEGAKSATQTEAPKATGAKSTGGKAAAGKASTAKGSTAKTSGAKAAAPAAAASTTPAQPSK